MRSCLIQRRYCSGSDVVDWLYSRVDGFQDRREARKYACNLLKVMNFDAVTDVIPADNEGFQYVSK